MSDTAIKVEGLGKEYFIGAREKRNETFREMLTSSVSAPFRRLRGMNGNAASEERFWALKDVSFKVKRGEVLGVIGHNGAGKSTLLKILSRITEPTEGRVTIQGRVSSLLEVGTGFHPELTGRENIYLNGAILGMSRTEINGKFDDIVDFAGVEKFLDTPVKRYSSGMFVRLAFAVAAHLDPEILIIDEVLAVGDAEFQRKCLGKMSEVAGGGRTVLFVSHNLDAISRTCNQGMVLNQGKIAFSGSAANAVEQYLSSTLERVNDLHEFRERQFQECPEFTAVWTASIDDRLCNAFAQGEPFKICMRVRPADKAARDFAVVIESREYKPLFATHLSDLSEPHRSSDEITFEVHLDDPRLRRGDYLVSFASFRPGGQPFDIVLHFPLFAIYGGGGTFPSDRRWGELYFPLKWTKGSDAQSHATAAEVLDAARSR